MVAKQAFEELVGILNASVSSIRCDTLAAQLARLGFEVRDGKQGGHKIFVHGGIPEFFSGSYNCGHGKNPEIKPAYIRKVLRILQQHEKEIIDFLEGQDDD
ncbi:type II toxin-antitoxin system HicA family toxin [Thiolapillus sp.]|uniref:type II toxin-antitoxin system HicA family toxin n=1 Tax=Thiolapillus sp. TaxID=2017437 RepID=UPI003AF750E3